MSEKKKPFSAWRFIYHFRIEIDGKPVLVAYEGEYPGFYSEELYSSMFRPLELEDTTPSDITYNIADHTRIGDPAYFIPVKELRKDVLDDTLLKLAEKLGVDKVYVKRKRKTFFDELKENLRQEIDEYEPKAIEKLMKDIPKSFEEHGIKLSPEDIEWLKGLVTNVYRGLIEEKFGIRKGVGGGNLILMGKTQKGTLKATEAAVEAIHGVDGCVAPFPGGICRSGSQVGSKYDFLKASTNVRLCPTLREQVPDSLVPPNVNSVLEIVLNGLSKNAVQDGMRAALQAAVQVSDLVRVTAANFGGKMF